jgi:putative DNA primase/helicase
MTSAQIGSRARPPVPVKLLDHHRTQLIEGAGIDPAVVAERGYESVHRGSDTADAPASLRRLKVLGVPKSGRDTPARLPGLVIPLYRSTGERVGITYRPDNPPRDPVTGKPRKYLQSAGRPAVLDVHPRNAQYMPDPTVPLWVTEGTKKADALTSRGQCVVALAGVFNWRSRHGTLGDWEDIQLKGRQVFVCFDSDARTNPNVLRAMIRFGRWLRSKGANPYYLITPSEVDGKATKGADDYLVAGGTVEGLRASATTTEPTVSTDDGAFSDAKLADIIAEDVLDGSYVWCKGLGWMAWAGNRWRDCSEETVTEAVRVYSIGRFEDVVSAARTGRDLNKAAADGWRSMLNVGRIRGVLTLARGIVERRADEFDAHPDLLNTPGGVVDLRTGDVGPADPDLLLTKVTRGKYRPGFVHEDWQSALGAVPAASVPWLQARFGQAATGYPTPDGLMPILQGVGENGKSLLTTDGVVHALGDFAGPASSKLFMSTKGSEHSTEMADLRGQRLLVAEELTEGRSIDVTALKRIQDVGTIKARLVHKDNMVFEASHSLFCTTNYVPVISETDHGTWRRLALVKFPYRFLKPNQPLHGPNDRAGDPGLKARIRAGATGQHDAIVTWVVEGARRWYEDRSGAAGTMDLPAGVASDTRAWRKEADRVLAFWSELLIADPYSSVWAVDLLSAFNKWLAENGHSPWAKETFHPRFKAHEETQLHRVVERRERNAGGLDRPAWIQGFGESRVPARPVVYRGVRFRTSADGDGPDDDQTPQPPEPDGGPGRSADHQQGSDRPNADGPAVGAPAGDVEPVAVPSAAATVCSACGLPMVVVDPGQTTHPTCSDVPTGTPVDPVRRAGSGRGSGSRPGQAARRWKRQRVDRLAERFGRARAVLAGVAEGEDEPSLSLIALLEGRGAPGLPCRVVDGVWVEARRVPEGGQPAVLEDVLTFASGIGWDRPFTGPAVRLDGSGRWISAASSAAVGWDALAHTGPVEIPERGQIMPGAYRVRVHPWAEDGPCPLGDTPYAGGLESVWVMAPTVGLLRDLVQAGRWPDVTVLDSWTSSHVVRLDESGWVSGIRDLRSHVISTYGRDSDQYREVKTAFGQSFSLMEGKRDPGRSWEFGCGVQRPDWAFTVYSLSAATMWRTWDRARRLSPDNPPVALQATDEIVVPEAAMDLVTCDAGIRDGRIRLDPSGSQLGTFKVKGVVSYE